MDGTSEPLVGRGCLEPSPEITYNEFNVSNYLQWKDNYNVGCFFLSDRNLIHILSWYKKTKLHQLFQFEFHGLKKAFYFVTGQEGKFHWLQTANKNHPIKLQDSYPSQDGQCRKTVDVAIKCQRLPLLPTTCCLAEVLELSSVFQMQKQVFDEQICNFLVKCV